MKTVCVFFFLLAIRNMMNERFDLIDKAACVTNPFKFISSRNRMSLFTFFYRQILPAEIQFRLRNYSSFICSLSQFYGFGAGFFTNLFFYVFWHKGLALISRQWLHQISFLRNWNPIVSIFRMQCFQRVIFFQEFFLCACF